MKPVRIRASRLFAGGAFLVAFSTALPSGAQAPIPTGQSPVGGYAVPMPATQPLPPYAGTPNHGYPAQPFRWGWFGAERYSPPVRWHRGYYGNHYRWHGRSAY